MAATALLLATVSYGVIKGRSCRLAGHAIFRRTRRDRQFRRLPDQFDLPYGRAAATREEILAIAGVTEHSSLLFLNADNARNRLKANPWIADATVLKLFPDRLHIAITERRAFALWQKEGRVR